MEICAIDSKEVDLIWRKDVHSRCGGEDFDARGTGYGFTQVLEDEATLEKSKRWNIPGDRKSAFIKSSVADPLLKMLQQAMDAGMKYYKEDPYATRYKDLRGIPGTHERIFQYLIDCYPELRQVKGFNSKCVQHLTGSIKGGLSNIIPATFFGPEAVLIVPIPGYSVIKEPENCHGINVINVPMIETENGWKFPLPIKDKEINDFLSSYKSRYLYLNSPHNPTGATLTKEEWLAILEWAREKDIKIFVDEAYDWIRFDDSPSILQIPGWWERCVVLQSISKGWNATGVRFGWLIGNPTAIKALRRPMDKKDSGLFGPTIAAALECLSNPQWARKTKEYYLQLHAVLAEELNRAGFNDARIPGGGLCQLTRTPISANGKEFESLEDCARWFREVLGVSAMHYMGSEGKEFLRWTVTIEANPECDLPTERDVIREAGRRLKEANFAF